MDSLFPQTPWSLIARGADAESGQQKEILRNLLSTYWQPVYFCVRARTALSPDEATNTVQRFFASLIQSDTLFELKPAHGRFRDFLKTELDRFLSSDAKVPDSLAASADSFDLTAAEDIPDVDVPPDEVFDHQWIMLVLMRAMRKLENMSGERDPHLYQIFSACDVDASDEDDALLAEQLGIDTSRVHGDLMEARRQFRRLVISEIHEYAADQDDAREEIKWLLG